MSTIQVVLFSIIIGGVIGIALGFIFHIVEFMRDERKIMAKEKRDAKMMRRTGHV